MKKIRFKAMLVVVLLLSIIYSCSNKKEEEKKDNNEIEMIGGKQILFKNKTIEKVIEDFSIKSKKNKIEIQTFEKLAYDDKTFYRAGIPSKKDSTYMIEYSGIEVTGLFTKVDMITSTDLGIVENIIVNLIEVSDEEIKDEEARQLYTDLLASMKENQLSTAIMYKNGLTYGLQISQETGEVVFFIQ